MPSRRARLETRLDSLHGAKLVELQNTLWATPSHVCCTTFSTNSTPQRRMHHILLPNAPSPSPYRHSCSWASPNDDLLRRSQPPTTRTIRGSSIPCFHSSLSAIRYILSLFQKRRPPELLFHSLLIF